MMFGTGLKMRHQNHRTVEMTGAFDGGIATLSHGLRVGTRVASHLGWRTIDALAVGDKVLTFDHGMQDVVEIRRAHVWLDASDTAEVFWPVVVPAGALGNREDLTLLPDQGVMIESDAALDMLGDPFAIVTAHSLVGLRGLHRRQPKQRVELVAVYFEHDEVIFAEGGALIHCPGDMSSLDKFMNAAPQTYRVLTGEQAGDLVMHITIEDSLRLASCDAMYQAATA